VKHASGARFVVVTALLLIAAGAHAQALNIYVTTVRAADSGPCDPQLEAMRPRLRKLAGYRAYQLVGEQQRRVAWRNTEEFDLGDGRSLVLLPKGMADERVMMQVRLLEGRRRLVDTNVRLVNGGTMVFGLGRDARTADGATLILLRAQDNRAQDNRAQNTRARASRPQDSQPQDSQPQDSQPQDSRQGPR
jgi:hypothetical protein